MAVLYPERPNSSDTNERRFGSNLTGLERIALSVVISVALVALLAFVVNYTFSIRAGPIMLVVAVATLVLAVLGYVRRITLPIEQRWGISVLRWPAAYWSNYIRGEKPRYGSQSSRPLVPTNGTHRALNVFFIVAILVLCASVGYAFVASPSKDKAVSELYLLGKQSNGNFSTKATPEQFQQGQGKPIWVGIGNHGKQQTQYTVVVSLGGKQIDQFSTTVDSGQSKRIKRTIKPPTSGNNLPLVFKLYVGKPTGKPYATDRLIVDVS